MDDLDAIYQIINDGAEAYRGVIRPAINPLSRLRGEMKMKMNELVDSWIAARNPAPNTAYATRRIVRRFTSLLGDDIDIGEIAMMDVG